MNALLGFDRFYMGPEKKDPIKKEKDWKGSKGCNYTLIGASNHTDKERQPEDFYATDPKAAELLLDIVDIPKDKPIWECAAGKGHLANVFKEHGYDVRMTDVVRRIPEIEIYDFLNNRGLMKETWDGTIITNPPYVYAQEFIENALESVTEGNKVIMFLKLTFLEGQKRQEMFRKYPPKEVWVASGRIICAMNGDFETYTSSAIAYAWYVWEKGYKGDTVLKWFN